MGCLDYTFLFLVITCSMKDTALFYEAIRSGNHKQLEAFLNVNPELANSRDSRGFTPLIFATYFDNEIATKILIDHNAEIDTQDGTGNTALIGVSFKGNEKLAKLLIDNGANINAINSMGTTALIFATMYNKEQIVKLLLDHNADRSIKDNEGRTAYDHALEKGFKNLLNLLKL